MSHPSLNMLFSSVVVASSQTGVDPSSQLNPNEDSIAVIISNNVLSTGACFQHQSLQTPSYYSTTSPSTSISSFGNRSASMCHLAHIPSSSLPSSSSTTTTTTTTTTVSASASSCMQLLNDIPREGIFSDIRRSGPGLNSTSVEAMSVGVRNKFKVRSCQVLVVFIMGDQF